MLAFPKDINVEGNLSRCIEELELKKSSIKLLSSILIEVLPCITTHTKGQQLPLPSPCLWL